MSRRRLVREAVELVVTVLGAAALTVIVFALLSQVVGGRGPSPSQGVPHAPRADSDAAPARSPAATTEAVSVGGGSGEDGRPFEGLQGDPAGFTAPQADAASTVTQSALTATVTAYTAIDPVPATPPASARPVETKAGESSNPPTKESGAGLYQLGVSVSQSGAYYAQKNEITSLIAASPWPPHLWGTVACLVQRESRGVATAVGLAGERGILQVHPITWPYLAQYGITPDALFDPATNLRAGYLLYVEAGGLRPWGGGCA